MKRVTSTSFITAAAFGIGMASTATVAEPIYEGRVGISFDSPIFGTTGSTTVTLNGPTGTSGTNAGLFHGEVFEPDPPAGFDGFDPTVIYRGLDDILSYCIDLFQQIGGGWNEEYRVYSLEDAHPVVDASPAHTLDRDFGRTLDFLGAVNYALQLTPGFVGDGDRHYNWLNPADGSMSGAIQVGIWEALYEVDAPLDITGGAFSATGLDASGEALLQTAFDAVNGVAGALEYTALDSDRVLLLISDTRQDVLVGDTSATVPAPAPAALMLAGLILMARRHAGLG
jgi:hypothetical protein